MEKAPASICVPLCPHFHQLLEDIEGEYKAIFSRKNGRNCVTLTHVHTISPDPGCNPAILTPPVPTYRQGFEDDMEILGLIENLLSLMSPISVTEKAEISHI